MSRRRTAIVLLTGAVLSAAFRLAGWSVPVCKVPFLGGAWIGWALLILLAAAGAWMLRKGGSFEMNPLTRKKVQRFRSIRRGHVSFLLLCALVFLASLDSLIVGKRPLLLKHDGRWLCPFVLPPLKASDVGGKGDSEPDYRALKEQFAREGQGDWLLMPPVPWEPKLDADTIIEPLVEKDGVVFDPDGEHKFSGIAWTSFRDKPGQRRLEVRYRNGLRHGDLRGWDAAGEQVEKGKFKEGTQISYEFFGKTPAADLNAATDPQLRRTLYPPTPPSWRARHYLGTDSAGNDVLAVLYGGLQLSVIASVLFLVFTFTIGITVGCSMGYAGGWWDLLVQRVIEIWSNIPFLLVVMILTTLVRPDLFILVAIIAMFSWMSTTAYLRTATYKERERDYVAAARLAGASTWRVITAHILPNVISTVVTLFPFKVAAIITSLAALDFLGFGLPPEEASWGRLLHEGTENFSAPWIVSAAFAAIVTTLILVTFVGEAVREAFDPKKYTTWQ
jgi:microcin C transport system permease protein